MGKVALVTGAGRGAGRGVARELARAGYAVVVADLDPLTAADAAEEVRALGAAGSVAVCDVSDEVAVAAMFEQIREEHGDVDVLVNTVAWIDPQATIAEMPTEVWHRSFRVNVDSVFFTTRAALPGMMARGRGVIVNFSSLNGTRGFPERGSYSASKAAVITLTQTTAMEGRRHGIRAYALVPGGIDGERVRELRARLADQPRQPRPPELGAVPELMDPDWIGRYVAFLASEEGRHLNGQALVIGEAARTPLQAIYPDL